MPSNSQKRGYIWLSILLLLVVATLLWVARCSGRDRGSTVDVEQLSTQVDKFGDSMQIAREKEDSLYRNRYAHHQSQRKENAQVGKEVETRSQDSVLRVTSKKQYTQRSLTFELNTADTTDLQQLYGIGPVFARRIVNYRLRLGGYVDKQQLMEVYGMTQELYEKISPYLTVDPSQAVRISVNTASIEQLKRHPYLDYYQAKAIVNYRKSGVHYGNLHDLSLVTLLDEKTLDKIAPYIEY